ncbi:MAG: tol-pal system protein YbgF [Magnetococcales bacterium]|nr:tol-pal system protein YbgF [Magnetococcales bacterium]
MDRHLPARHLLIGATLLLLSGCATTTNPDGTPPVDPQAEIPRLQKDLAEASKSEANNRAAMSELTQKLGLLEKELRSVRGELEEQRYENKRLGQRVEKTEQAAAQPAPISADGAIIALGTPATPPVAGQTIVLSPPAAAPGAAAPAPTPPAATTTAAARPAVAPPPATPAIPAASPGESLSGKSGKELYEASLQALKTAQYAKAVEGFTAYIAKNASDPLAGNSQYWIGEAHYVQKQYAEALQAFNQVLVKWPQSEKAPAALLKIAFSFQGLQDNNNAKMVLNKLIKDYPNATAEVTAAKNRLKALEENRPR